MLFFMVKRGAYKARSINVFADPSVIKIQNLRIPAEGAIVTNFSVNAVEKYGMIQCFGNSNHIYAFGADPERSSFSITYIVILTQMCGSVTTAKIKTLYASYNKAKLSQSKKTIEFSLGSGLMYKGALLDFSVDVFDPEINAVRVTLSGIILGTIGPKKVQPLTPAK